MRMPEIEIFHNFAPNPRKFSRFGEKGQLSKIQAYLVSWQPTKLDQTLKETLLFGERLAFKGLKWREGLTVEIKSFQISSAQDFKTMQFISKLVSKTILVHLVYSSANISTRKAYTFVRKSRPKETIMLKINLKILKWIFSTLNKLR